MPPSLHFRVADPSDVAALFDIRQAAIRRLSLTHLSECEAAAWAERGGIPRVEQAIAKDEVWVATLRSHVVGWLHLVANSIEGLYVSPTAARQGVGTALVRLAESHIARRGHTTIVLESSLNAMGFYFHLGYAAGANCSSGAVTMCKQVAGRPNPAFNPDAPSAHRLT